MNHQYLGPELEKVLSFILYFSAGFAAFLIFKVAFDYWSKRK
jgi:hypothetical protein